ncbi:MAG: FKBP-type peptidyl-prolyl cis-trans isomerase [Cyclobacteriaceae bacterium]|nr:FKBP-type peptidyl-prolyl cis-trans isomerase [Cyclobacteriaceae bacterium]MDH4294931.1 FKBP-type peptidyl-prolyl cis-trans isomerase [Cyclobacteriaceae bacterium]MDH5249352.1 FKBP-type peptidyl-prolyl cis-trans isomerase [Cyclobacteriaceae bacterium]
MNRISIVLVGLTLLCVACTKSEKETPNGLKFTVLKTGDGVLPVKEDVVVFDYLLKDSKDSVWSDTYSQGIPAAIPIADSSAIATERGMFQMFRMLSKGDSVRVAMSISKFFQDIAGSPTPPDVDSTLNISYYIQVKEIMKMDQFREYQMNLMENKRSSQVAKDAAIISKYLADNNVDAEQDSSGIRYVIHRSNGGTKPTAENCVEVDYKGSFMESGEVFDQQKSIAFPLNRVIPGWQRAIPMLGIGDSATFYIPSGLAYGPEGAQGAIPPNAILVFDVSLLGIGNGFDQATGNCN